MIWNSEGTHDPAKHSFIQETTSEQWLDFTALLKIGRFNVVVPFLRILAAGFDFAWFSLLTHALQEGSSTPRVFPLGLAMFTLGIC